MTAVKKLLKQGISVNETSEEGESLLSLACSAGYYELAQVSALNIIKIILFEIFNEPNNKSPGYDHIEDYPLLCNTL